MNQKLIWLLEQHSNQRALERLENGDFSMKNYVRLKSLREAGLIKLQCEWKDKYYVLTELGQNLLEEDLPPL